MPLTGMAISRNTGSNDDKGTRGGKPRADGELDKCIDEEDADGSDPEEEGEADDEEAKEERELAVTHDEKEVGTK